MASSQGKRSASVNGTPLRIFSLLLEKWKSWPSRNTQPKRAASDRATVVFPEPVTPITKRIISIPEVRGGAPSFAQVTGGSPERLRATLFGQNRVISAALAVPGTEFGKTTVSQTHATAKKAGLFYFVFVMFAYTTCGPFGMEEMVTTSGPGLTLLYLLVIPFFWCIPVSLVAAELTTAIPVEGGFYRWVRAGYGNFWGFLAGGWNWRAPWLLGGTYGVLFSDYLGNFFPSLVGWKHYLVSLALIALLAYVNVRVL